MASIVQPNPAEEAQRQRLFQQLANLPPDIRAFIAQQYNVSQISVLPLPYWSRVRFNAARTGAGPFTYTVDTSERKAFAYPIGQSRVIAGFPTGNATLADTNLLKQSETRDNADVWIWGIAANLLPGSDGDIAGGVWRETSVQISLNGTQSIPLGTLEMFPGAGGLYGVGEAKLRAPATNVAGGADDGEGARISFLQNGNPMAGNFFRLPQPFKWASVGTAGADSSLVITCKPERTVTATATDRAAVPVVAMVTPGTIEPFTSPEDGAVFVDVGFHLVCVAVAKRSVNV
jgi:hypothetical protein